MPDAQNQAPQPIMAQARRMFLFLIILTAASQIGMQGWITLFNNFAVEAAGFDGFQTTLQRAGEAGCR